MSFAAAAGYHPSAPPRPRIGSAVMVIEDGEVLLGRRGKEPNYGRWVLPGGKIEPFESLDQAATREVAEETGLLVEVVRRLGVFEIIEPPNEHRIIVYSVARPIGGHLEASSDLFEVEFVPIAALDSYDLTPVVRSVLVVAGLFDPVTAQAHAVTG